MQSLDQEGFGTRQRWFATSVVSKDELIQVDLELFTTDAVMRANLGASEADPDLGFMARMMALCSLPRTNPGDRKEYKRVNGPYTLYMTAGGGNKLPFGNLPRLLLAWVSTEAVRTQSRELVLGRSLAEFMRALGIYHNSGGRGGVQTRLFSASVQLIYEDEHGNRSGGVLVERAQTRRAGAVGEQNSPK